MTTSEPTCVLTGSNALGADGESTLYEPTVTPWVDALAIRATSSQLVVSQQPMAPPYLTPSQASLFNALFSLSETNSIGSSASSPALDPDLNYRAPHAARSNPYSPSTLISNSDRRDLVDDDEDFEGTQEILCDIPVALAMDRTVESNSLPFVLQWHAQWLPLAMFDPYKIIYQVKETIISQFSESPTSQFRLILISEVMRTLVKRIVLDEGGRRVLRLIEGQVWQNVTGYQMQQWPTDEKKREHARKALNNVMDLILIQVVSAPLSSILRLVQSAAPVFISACPPPHPPHIRSIMLETGLNLKSFVVADLITSVTTGRQLACSEQLTGMGDRYHVPWSLDLCEELVKTEENQGLQSILGVPDQFILLFAYVDAIKKEAEALGTMVDTRIIERIEDDMHKITIFPCHSRDPSLAIGRMVVQECWREAVLIYIYMVLYGAHALDPRVKQAQKRFMKLMNTIKPGRNPDSFLVLPMIVAGVAATKPSHQLTIKSRFLNLPEFVNPNTAGNDSLRILGDIWYRTNSEGRAARWEDLREACRRITGI
ncbi:unnamed protein product [Rhizoctonia solani]|uniref:Fungal-specific transcription factor domain protein n=1 Tax=Rhizoctonia solani TaxID=456999 RepID=A0A8H3GJ07_9AGAM|nr:unnamed protein product [Rhizoctonia solani]